MKPILILAVGNPSRGDDAFGPQLADRLTQWLSQQPQGVQSQVDVICEQQLMVEHVYDLQGRQRVLFLDASASGTPALRMQPVQAWPQPPTIQSHQCPPPQLLALHQHLLKTAAPPCDILTTTGTCFELGAPLSEPTQRCMQDAWDQLMRWLQPALEQTHA